MRLGLVQVAARARQCAIGVGQQHRVVAWQRDVTGTEGGHVGPLLALHRDIERTAQVVEVVLHPIRLAIDDQRGTGDFVLEQLALLAVGAVFDALVQAQVGVLVGQSGEGEGKREGQQQEVMQA